MSTKKQMLVVADEKEEDVLALEKAKEIALAIDAQVEVIKFISEQERDSTKQASLIAHQKQTIDQHIARIFSSSMSVPSEVVVTKDISAWIVNAQQHRSVDLVLKTGHRSESLFHTPTDWQLMRTLNCPVLIASHEKWKSKSDILITIDLKTDGDQHEQLNDLVLSWAKIWSEATGCTVHVMYSIPIPKPFLALDLVEQQNYQRQQEPAAKKQLTELLARFNLGKLPMHISAGPADKTIPHVANQLKADLVMMGTLGRQGLKGKVLGNTAEKVLHHLRTDVLVVKPS